MLIDAHAHCDFYSPSQFEKAVGEIERLEVLTLSVTTRPRDYVRLERLAERSPLIVPCFGVHPRNASDYVHNLAALDEYVDGAAMVGEIGLDFSAAVNPCFWPAQEEVFRYLLERAVEQGKAVNVHAAGASAAVAEMLADAGAERVVVHGFDGPLDVLATFASRGYLIGVGYDVVLSKHHADVVRALPDELILTETDAPFNLERLAGSCGMPSSLTPVVAKIARLRGMTSAAVETLVADNFRRFAGGDPAFAPALGAIGSVR